MWGFAGVASPLFRTGSFTNADHHDRVHRPLRREPRHRPSRRAPTTGAFDIFSPSGRRSGSSEPPARSRGAHGEWWTLVTAIYLHGGVLHILFNVLWIRQLGPAVEELYGPARCFVIFTVSGAAGFVVSNLLGVPFTVGASGSIFGLLGAMVAFGRRRGGVFGSHGPASVRSVGAPPVHPGILHVGREQSSRTPAASSAVSERALCCRSQSAVPKRPVDQLLAGGCLVVTALSFALTAYSALVG